MENIDIKQLLTILWSRKSLIGKVFAGTIITAILITLIMSKKWQSTATVVVERGMVDPLTGNILTTVMTPMFVSTQVDIIKSHNVARRVVDKLKLSQMPVLQEAYTDSDSTVDISDWIADFILLKNFKVTPSRESSLIDISYVSEEPSFAAAVANAFAEEYIQASINMRTQPAKIGNDWFEEQVKHLRDRLELAQDKLSSFQQESGIVATDERLDIENARLVDLSRQLVESQGRTDEVQSRMDLIKSVLQGKSSADTLQEVLSNSLISQLKAELAAKEANLALLSNHMDKNHPTRTQAEAEVASLRQKVNNETQKVLSSMSSTLSASKQRDGMLSKSLAEQKKKVLELKKVHDEVAVLMHEVENDKLAYDAAMQRSVQTWMESELNHSDIAILNRALPGDLNKPDRPKIILNMLLAIVLGGILGIIVALIAELRNRRVRTSYDLERMDISVLAILPRK